MSLLERQKTKPQTFQSDLSSPRGAFAASKRFSAECYFKCCNTIAKRCSSGKHKHKVALRVRTSSTEVQRPTLSFLWRGRRLCTVEDTDKASRLIYSPNAPGQMQCMARSARRGGGTASEARGARPNIRTSARLNS